MAPTILRKSGFDAFLTVDVRHVLYDLIKDDLPPLSDSYLGFILSCTAALGEIRHLAAQSLQKYLFAVKSEFFTKLWFTIIIPQSFANCSFSQLRNITITIPASIMLSHSHHMSSNEALSLAFLMFYTLFTKPFDRVTILFRDEPESAYLPQNFITNPHRSFKCHAQYAIRELSYITAYACYKDTVALDNYPRFCGICGLRPTPLLSDLARPCPGTSATLPHIQRPPASRGWCSKMVKTKRISLAWDLRKLHSASTDVFLEGLWSCVSRRKLAINSLGRTKGRQGPSPCARRYEIMSLDKLVGEVGLVSESRWMLSDPEELQTIKDSRFADVHRCDSAGIGGVIRTRN